jgi:hypothetical protein
MYMTVGLKISMGGDLVEYGMMFNQTQTFLDDAEGQAERCEGCKTKKIKPVDRFINFTSPLVNVCTAPIVPKCPTKATNFPVPVPNVTFPKDVRS